MLYCSRKPWLSSLLVLLFIADSLLGKAQLSVDSISEKYIYNTIHYLASDKLKGRVNFTNEQLQVADFLCTQMDSFGLVPLPDRQYYTMPFSVNRKNNKTATLVWNDKTVSDSLFYFFSPSLAEVNTELDSFDLLVAYPPISPNLLVNNWQITNPLIIQLNLPDSIDKVKVFSELKLPSGKPNMPILLVASSHEYKKAKLSLPAASETNMLYNIIGMLPGKTKPDEVVIFSAHYDHISHGLDGNAYGIFNGANDNASGTTAVLALADYYAKRNDNERTIMFCLFAGEELGLLGSYAFAPLVKPESIKAVINIEMIGKTNATGENAFMVIGPDHSTLTKILSNNLKPKNWKVKPLYNDPMYLFSRSDNYPFYLKGIVAHTIMCSDDREACYHKPCDNADRIDTKNMTKVVKAIAIGAETIISGKDTPVFK